MRRLAGLSMLALWVSPALAAGASDFVLVNGTGASLAELSIRRSGTQDWKSLAAAPSPGARSSLRFSDADCAFDIKATVAGVGPVVWNGVNLCAVKSVTLNRGDSEGAWVDYDR